MKKRFIAVLLAASMTAGLYGCGSGAAQDSAQGSAAAETTSSTYSDEPASQQFYAMDTVMNIQAYGEDAQTAIDECVKYINGLEDEISRTDENSEIYKLNHGESSEVSEDTLDIVQSALDLAKESGGYFDPTVAPLSDLWQIGTDDAHIPEQSEIDDAKALVGYDRVKIDGSSIDMDDGMEIDLGGIGKGYAADHVVQIMNEYGVERAVIALGGNVYVMGEKAADTGWKVGISDPDDSTGYLGVLEVSSTSVVTSGDYERYFEEDGVRYCHIFDTSTGYPAQTDIRSVTIVDDNSTRADAFTTALFVMGYDKAVEFCAEHDIEAVFVLSDHTVHVTDGLKDCFTLDSADYTYEE